MPDITLNKRLRAQKHHWWPVSVSSHWKGEDGCAGWLSPNDEVRRIPPKELGAIRGGHHIKLGKVPGETTDWDRSFEQEFDRADNAFPTVIDWLECLAFTDRRGERLSERFSALPVHDVEFARLVECLVSLAVRSPRTREAAVRLAEELRGPLPEHERNALISLNINNAQRSAASSLSRSGKLLVVYSPDREFVFGDGFYHTLTTVQYSAPSTAKILAPITPRISVFYVRPTACMVEPRLCTLVINETEADFFNNTMQIYAAKAIFYRNERPRLIEAFRKARHLVYASSDNSIAALANTIPGVRRMLGIVGFPERERRDWWGARS